MKSHRTPMRAATFALARAGRRFAGVAAIAAPLFAHAGAAPRFGETPMPGLGGAIDLVDQDGHAFHLWQLQGRGALVFFGYTHCGTLCPTALVTAHEVLAASADAPVVLFVTLDPLSDDPATLRKYLQAFDRRIVGLTGDPRSVAEVAERYGVGRAPRVGVIDHSARWYLLDASGRLVRVYADATPAALLVADFHRVAPDNQGAVR